MKFHTRLVTLFDPGLENNKKGTGYIMSVGSFFESSKGGVSRAIVAWIVLVPYLLGVYLCGENQGDV